MRVTNRVVDLVQEGVDVALRVRAKLDDSGSLVVKNLGSHGVLVASPRAAAAHGPTNGPDDLRACDGGHVGRRRPRQLAPGGPGGEVRTS